MKERPILFSGEMVRALIAGRKTQTRRLVKPQWAILTDDPARALGVRPPTKENPPVVPCPYGVPGDRLWVKEPWSTRHGVCHLKPTELPESTQIIYRADFDLEVHGVCPWRPSLFMRRWMSRLTLEVASVRVERLHAITRGDAMAEGCPFANMADGPSPRDWYRALWGKINGAGSWDLNPWVWVVEFRRADK